MIFIVIAFTRGILNCINANRRGKSRTCSTCLVTSRNRRSNPGCSSWITRKFLVMIPLSQYYKESIFIYYSYVTFYACSFPHNNKYTYIRYIFKVSISMYKCSMTQFFYVFTYNIHVKVYCYCLTLNCYYLDIELILSNGYCPTIVVWTVTVQRLLSNHCCLNCCCPIVTVWTVVVQWLLFCCPTVAVQPLLFEH